MINDLFDRGKGRVCLCKDAGRAVRGVKGRYFQTLLLVCDVWSVKLLFLKWFFLQYQLGSLFKLDVTSFEVTLNCSSNTVLNGDTTGFFLVLY